jgi:hypothetical protein
VSRGKRTTGRVVFFRELGIRMSFTLEGSMMGGHGCDFVPMSFGELEEEICRRSAQSRMKLAHFNTSHYQTLGAMFGKALLVLSHGDRGLSSKCSEVISELIAEVSTEKSGNGKRGGDGGGGRGNAAKAQTSDEESSSMSGSYATSRRNTMRKKKASLGAAQIPPASQAELLEVYKVLLHTQGLPRASLADDGDDGDEDDGDDLADGEDEDSDGGDDPENEDYDGIEEDELETLDEI